MNDDGISRNAHGFWKGLYTVDVLEHAGNTDSFSSNFSFSKDENMGVIVFTNQAGEAGLSYGLLLQHKKADVRNYFFICLNYGIDFRQPSSLFYLTHEFD